MEIAGIIPARFASTRFPGKPLAQIGGKSMIRRVYEQASACEELNSVTVATDDERIYEHVIDFGGNAVYTSASHPSGTDRCAEAVEKLNSSATHIINIQGDEPFIEPNHISVLANILINGKSGIATLAEIIEHPGQVQQDSIVKVVIDKNGKALYFSRAAIPFNRENKDTIYYRHIGLYGYERGTLRQIVQLAPSMLEKTEMLEQLRWLENGFNISVGIGRYSSLSVDTPEDLQKAEDFLRNRNLNS